MMGDPQNIWLSLKPILLAMPNILYCTLWPEKKRPELCVTITAHILYGAKFPLAHL